MKPLYLLVSIVLCCTINYSIGQPSNDDVCNATLLTVDGSQSCGTNINATHAPNSPACNNGPDVWYKFIASANSPVQIRMTTPASGNVLASKIGVYTVAGCPTASLTFTNVPFLILNVLNPNSSASPSAVPAIGGGTKLVYKDCQKANKELYKDTAYLLTDTLTAGTTYYIAVASGEATVDGMGNVIYEDGDFCIALQSPPIAPSCPTLLSPIGNITAPALSTTLRWRSVPNATMYKVYIQSTYTQYTKDTFFVVPGLDYDQPISWRVSSMNQSITKDCSASLATFNTEPLPATPTNDECVDALELNSSITLKQNNASATSSSPATDCSGNPINEVFDNIHDVWFKFTPAFNKGTIALRNIYGSWRYMQIYKSLCDVGSIVQCTTDSTVFLTGLIPGNTYQVRVFSNTPSFGDIGGFTPYFHERSGPFDITFYDGVLFPVTLANFSGERHNNQNILKWETLSEQNNKGFEIMRSEDGINFTSISSIPSKSADGNSVIKYTYYFIDQNANAPHYYYQLKQIDKDGQTTLFSSIVTIKHDATPHNNILKINNIYPNPSKDLVHLSIYSPFSESVNLLITDVVGKIVWQGTTQLMTGNQTMQIPIYQLTSGIYMIKMICSDGRSAAPVRLSKQ